jgi:valyl-tRNA synthetase
MYNIHDWCVSRQLWWGHRIPAWYCGKCGELIVARQDPTECPVCGSAELRQESDVLDTWFSSGLWPFSTLGWPDQTEDLKTFYPTSLLITGFDILFFWVARMIMLGLEFMGEVPFRQVYIHALVRDPERQKMSKTKGNVIDPLVVTEQYGTDAVRMALLSAAAPGTDIVFKPDRLESSRAFANKIWNAARFLFMNMERCAVEPWAPENPSAYIPEGHALEDRWIFARLNAVAQQVNRAVATHRFHEVAQSVWHFFWGDFCDWYVELKKLRFKDNSGLNADWRNLLAAFESALRLLHPVMPFLTEELWQRLVPDTPSRPVSIAVSKYPEFRDDLADDVALAEMDQMQNIITTARNRRAEMKLDPKLTVRATLTASLAMAEQKEAIEKLANLELTVTGRPASGFELVLELPAAQLAAQKQRLEKDREALLKVIANSRRQLSDETFLSKAPAKVVDSIRGKLSEYEAQLRKLEEELRNL